MTPIHTKAARRGDVGGDGNGTISRPKLYPKRDKCASSNPEPWRPVRIGDTIDESLRRILREGAES